VAALAALPSVAILLAGSELNLPLLIPTGVAAVAALAALPSVAVKLIVPTGVL
jgi:hypothetical protein